MFSFRKIVNIRLVRTSSDETAVSATSAGIMITLSPFLLRKVTSMDEVAEHNPEFLKLNDIMLSKWFVDEGENKYERTNPTDIEFSNIIINKCYFALEAPIGPFHDWLISFNSEQTWKYLDRLQPNGDKAEKFPNIFRSYSYGPHQTIVDETLFSLITSKALEAKYSLKELKFSQEDIVINKAHPNAQNSNDSKSVYTREEKRRDPDDSSTIMRNAIRLARVDVMKYFGRRVMDLYNEYGLLVVTLVLTPSSTISIIVLVLGSISLSLCNGGKSSPDERPGDGWWGSGHNLDEDKWHMNGGNYIDNLLRFGVPYVLTATLNLTVLGKQSEIVGWSNAVIFGTSEAYLFAFSFLLLCICENTFRENSKPLGNLRKYCENKYGISCGRFIARIIVFFLQILCMCVPIVINIMVAVVPSQILIPVIGFIVFYVGTFARFVFEPKTLTLAWNRSNLKFLCDIINMVFDHTFYFLTCQLNWSALKEFYANYIDGYMNNIIIFLLCVVVFALSVTYILYTGYSFY